MVDRDQSRLETNSGEARSALPYKLEPRLACAEGLPCALGSLWNVGRIIPVPLARNEFFGSLTADQLRG
jgi:hypothetical protein